MNTQNPNTPTTDYDLESILDAPSEELMNDREPTWKNPEEVLYMPIVVTRANLKEIDDPRKGRKVTRAFVNFYHLDDPTQEPFVFSAGWMALRNQVAQMLARKLFPVPCGVAEMREQKPFVDDNGVHHYPLRFVSVDRLEAAEVAATADALRDAPETPAATTSAATTSAATTPAAPAAAPNRPYRSMD